MRCNIDLISFIIPHLLYFLNKIILAGTKDFDFVSKEHPVSLFNCSKTGLPVIVKNHTNKVIAPYIRGVGIDVVFRSWLLKEESSCEVPVADLSYLIQPFRLVSVVYWVSQVGIQGHPIGPDDSCYIVGGLYPTLDLKAHYT